MMPLKGADYFVFQFTAETLRALRACIIVLLSGERPESKKLSPFGF